jgi:hypothetical protein
MLSKNCYLDDAAGTLSRQIYLKSSLKREIGRFFLPYNGELLSLIHR